MGVFSSPFRRALSGAVGEKACDSPAEGRPAEGSPAERRGSGSEDFDDDGVWAEMAEGISRGRSRGKLGERGVVNARAGLTAGMVGSDGELRSMADRKCNEPSWSTVVYVQAKLTTT